MLSPPYAKQDTIVAQATPPGRGGIGIIRVSGKEVKRIAQAIIGKVPKPRLAELHHFSDQNKAIIDAGIVLYFPSPHSYTGEDVLEFQGHGSPVALDRLIQCIIRLGARIAEPGEFSLRAFLHNKIDLTQAEAIADLINSASQQAAYMAVQSLQGVFSQHIQSLLRSITELRMYVEAAIDFPEEEIDFLNDGKVQAELNVILAELEKVNVAAKQGVCLQEAKKIVIAGLPNAGKSTLLNCLSGRQSAIVTDVPGTTRDLIRENILLDGLSIQMIDTAGLRSNAECIEQEGIDRAWQEIKQADAVLLLVDASLKKTDALKKLTAQLSACINGNVSVKVIMNKIDLIEKAVDFDTEEIYISAQTGQGMEMLYDYLKTVACGDSDSVEGSFIARRRHLDALQRTQDALISGYRQLQQQQAGELLAEELRIAQQALGEITGEFTSDDLLGKIFGEFCIGK